MKLWLLTRKDNCGWDEYDSFVVRANDEEKARQLAREKGYWTSDDNVICEVILVEGKPEVILGSYNAG